MNARPRSMPSATVAQAATGDPDLGEQGDGVQVPARLWLWIVLMLMAMSLVSLPAPAAEPVKAQFDHVTSGFILTGRHRVEKCEN